MMKQEKQEMVCEKIETIYEQEGCKTKKDVCDWHGQRGMKIIEVPECLFSRGLVCCLEGILQRSDYPESAIYQTIREVLDFMKLPNE